MDADGKASKSGDVVVVISGDVSTLQSSSATAAPRSCTSPEVALFSSSPNKPPNTPPTTETLTRRKSLARSVHSSQKSRFGEQSVPLDSQLIEEIIEERAGRTAFSLNKDSSNRMPPDSSSTLKGKMRAEDEDENEQIYNKVSSHRKLRYMRVKIKVLIEWVVFICILGCFLASLTVHELQRCKIWGLEFWKWCLLVLVTFFGIFFTKWLTRLLVFLIERNFLFRKKVLYFVHGLKKSVQVFVWLSLVLLTWVLLFNCGPDRSVKTSRLLDYVTWTLVSLVIGSFLWVLKTLLLKILASSFHLNRFFNRIHESIIHLHFLNTLSGRPVMESQQDIGRTNTPMRSSFRILKKGKGGKEEEVIDMNKLYRLKKEKVSTWTIKEWVDVIWSSDVFTISNAIDDNDYDEEDEQIDEEITGEMKAIATAYGIFKNVAHTDDMYIHDADLKRFMIREEVDLLFSQVGVSKKTGQIEKNAFIDWVVKSYKSWKALAHALTDTKTAVKQLNKLISGILVVVTVIAWLLLMEIATTKVLLVLSSQLLLAGFIFKNVCKTIFEAIIFVFVVHPFDVGDRCVIDGVQMIVEEMNILTTVFLRYDKQMIYYPNSVLATKPISNFYRSPNMGDCLEFCIDFKTPVDKIGALKEKIKDYLENNSQLWHADHFVVVKEIENVNKLKMALYFNHTMNFQEYPQMLKRRSELVIEMKKFFEDLSIIYNLLPQEVRLVESAMTYGPT